MTTGRLGQQAAPPNAAYAGQVVHFPDPVRAARHPRGVRVDERGYPDFSPYARAAAEIAEPPEGFGVDELRLTDYVSANAALHGVRARAVGHDCRRWRRRTAGRGTTWPGARRLELVPVEVKALLRHHGGLATAAVDQDKRGTRPLQETRPAHFGLPKSAVAVTEQQVQGVEEDLGYRLPGAYRSFLKAAGGCAPVGAALDAELGLLVDQPFFTVRDEAAVNDLVYVNKCLRDHLTKDYLGVGFVQGGLLAVKVQGRAARFGVVLRVRRRAGRGSDVAAGRSGWSGCCCRAVTDFDAFLPRLAGNPPELETVANLMVDGGFARCRRRSSARE